MAKKGIPYSRFSGKRQEAGDSQRRQDALAEQAAREEGVELDLTLNLHDKGISGFRGANWEQGELGKFLDLVDAGVIAPGSVLIIEQVNRLSRLPWMRQVQLWQEILSRGIVIRTCCPPSRYTRDNMNELAVGCPVVIFMMLAHQESQQKSDWVREAWGEKKRRAASERRPHGRDCPAWIEPVTEPHPRDSARVVTTGYRLREDRAAIVRSIFESARDGKGAFTIRKELEDRGVRPFGKCGRWTLSYVKKILSGREALGEYQPYNRPTGGNHTPQGSPIPDYYPAVVSEEVFDSARAACRSRRKKGGRRGQSEANLFTHLVFDAHDGRPVHTKTRRNAKKIYRYLTTPAELNTVPYDAFERGVLSALTQLKPRDVDGRHEVDALTARVDELQRSRSGLGLELDAIDAQIRELPPSRWPKRAVARMAELEELIAQRDEELRAAKEQANTSGRTEVLADLQTCVGLLDSVADTPREDGVRRRIKARLPLVFESVWVRVQALHRRGRYIHVRIYLHGGEQRYFVLACGHTSGVPPLALATADFRGGAERGHAHQAGPG
jgi:DNA invertase Pin-like site-specific DNA recombinase